MEQHRFTGRPGVARRDDWAALCADYRRVLKFVFPVFRYHVGGDSALYLNSCALYGLPQSWLLALGYVPVGTKRSRETMKNLARWGNPTVVYACPSLLLVHRLYPQDFYTPGLGQPVVKVNPAHTLFTCLLPMLKGGVFWPNIVRTSLACRRSGSQRRRFLLPGHESPSTQGGGPMPWRDRHRADGRWRQTKRL